MSDQIVVPNGEAVLQKIQDLPNQFENAWTALWTKGLGVSLEGINHIVVLGMGGSGIAGRLARELYLQKSKLPIEIWADYQLPSYVNETTLVIAVSYSGNTEETLDAVTAAITQKAKVVAVTTGGKLLDVAKTSNVPVIDVSYDSAPREAVGFLYGSVLTLLAKLGAITLTENDYFAAVKELRQIVDGKTFLPKAQELAMSMNNKVPLVIAQSPLTAVAKRWVNQLNENAKTFATAVEVPEMCHNFIVGLDFAVTEKMFGLYLESASAFSRNVVRRQIIEKIFKKKEITFTPLSIRATSPLAEQWLFIYFGDLLSYYLAGVNGVDPSVIESINFLKEELQKA